MPGRPPRSIHPSASRDIELSPSLFETLGVQPALGRAFTDCRRAIGATDRRHSRRRVLAPARRAPRHHRPDAGVRRGSAYRCRRDAGGFSCRGLQRAGGVYRPVTPQHFAAGNRNFRAFRAIARLQPGVSIEQAQSIAATVGERLAGEYPETNRGRTFSLQPLQADLVGRRSPRALTNGRAGGTRAADRRGQPDESSARARRRASARGGRAVRTWRRRVAAGENVVDRRRAARGRGRCGRRLRGPGDPDRADHDAGSWCCQG